MNSSPNPLPTNGFEELVIRARAGDGEALGEVLKTCRHLLQYWTRHKLPQDLQSKVGASDIVQICLMEAHADFSNFEGDTQLELHAWLWKILEHKFGNIVRTFRGTAKRRVACEVSLDEAGKDGGPPIGATLAAADPPAPEALADAEKNRLIRQAIHALPAGQRFLLRIHYLDGQSFEQIGAVLGCSTDAARGKVRRALSRLTKVEQFAKAVHGG